LAGSAAEVGQRVRKVAEAAVTTAFQPRETHSQEIDGGASHG
jgi:hypothetical protein